MRIGVVFPQTEIGRDPGAVRDYAQTVEELGFNHLLVYDHVLGADREVYTDWKGPYDSKSLFHEPFVLFGYLAGITKKLELVTGVIILPQRQTALVAKQAAEIDVLSGGRLRLGIGLGWNSVEYEALGEDFHTRGRRINEQVEVLRGLWTQDVVNYSGNWQTIRGAGINPLPIQRPIPIWMGGGAEPVLRRIASLADGWFPQFQPDEKGKSTIDRLFSYAREVGRDPATIGIEGRINLRKDNMHDWETMTESWRNIGATHLSVNTMNGGLESPQMHIELLRKFRELIPI